MDIIDEDAIDTEALQAQIDLSMSFAQGLVSSWMEPHKLPRSSRKRDLEKELSEHMRRPPRLGVGASIPEGHQNTSREVARLKGKLTGKRLREDEEKAAAAPPGRSDDADEEDESRAGAIKKKQKPDPFDIRHRKKKRKKHDEQGKPPLPVAHFSSENAPDDDGKPNGSLHGPLSPTQRSKQAKQQSLAQNASPPPLQSPALNEVPSIETKSEHSAKPESTLAINPSRRLSDSDCKAGPTSPHPLPRNPRAELLKYPLLNLTGPPLNDDDSESDGTKRLSPLTSPKKKKKRRKKKKHHPIATNSTTNAALDI